MRSRIAHPAPSGRPRAGAGWPAVRLPSMRPLQDRTRKGQPLAALMFGLMNRRTRPTIGAFPISSWSDLRGLWSCHLDRWDPLPSVIRRIRPGGFGLLRF